MQDRGERDLIIKKRVRNILNIFFVTAKASTLMLMEADMRGNIKMMISMGKVKKEEFLILMN